MQHSSRHNPCVICGRTKDDKCRSSSTRIYCYVGDTFAPPASLRIGDKIKIAGECWRLFSTTSGFSQNSYAFALDDGPEYRFLSYEDKREFRKNCIRLTRIFIKKERLARIEADKLKDEEMYHELTLEQFRANKVIAESLLNRFNDMADFAFANRRYIKDSIDDLEKSRRSAKAMQESLKTIQAFELLYLNGSSARALSPESTPLAAADRSQ